MPASAQLGPCTIETVAGGGVPSEADGSRAVDAELFSPDSVRLAPDGSLYIADTLNYLIRRVMPDGTIATVAGTGEPGFSGDGGPATQARLSGPRSLALGPDGSYYFVDSLRVRRVSSEGIISTVAGDGGTDIAVDGSLATETGLRGVEDLTLDAVGNLYLGARTSHQVWKVATDGIIHRLAGSSDPVRPRRGFSGDGGPAQDAELDSPSDVAVDGEGNVYIADSGNGRIRRVKPDDTIETFLGNVSGSTADGTHRTEALLRSAFTIELDGEGRLYWLELGDLRRLDAEERVETVFDSADLFLIRVSVSPAGTIHAIGFHQVFRLLPPGQTELIAGVGPTAARGDGGPATQAVLSIPRGLAAGPDGKIYVADSSFSRVLTFTPGGSINIVAGTGIIGSSGDGGPARSATLFDPLDVAMDSAGNLYIAESSGSRVRKVDPAGTISRFAGTGSRSCTDRFLFCGEGGSAVEADLPFPSGVAVDGQDTVYILHGRLRQGRPSWIRRVTAEGIIETISDAGIAEEFARRSAVGFVITPDDRITVSLNDSNVPYYQADPGEMFVAVPGSQGFAGPATVLAADREGNVYFSDRANVIARLTADGILNTIVGGEGAGFSGDGGPAAQAQVASPRDLLLVGGDLYFSDSGNRRVRRINDVGACAVVVRPQIARSGIRNAASFSFLLAPGTIFTIFGVRLGPDEPLSARLGPDGRVTSELGGTRVLVDGIPATMVFTSAIQVSAIVPYGIAFGGEFRQDGFFAADRVLPVQVEYDGQVSELGRLFPTPVAPGIFTLGGSGRGRAAALNQDGTLNGPLNPAPAGSVIVLFATGEGQTDPPGVDGKIAVPPLPRPLADVEVLIDGEPAVVLYAGAAPGLVAGVLQVNALIPPDLVGRGAVSVQLVMGSYQTSRFEAMVIVGE